MASLPRPTRLRPRLVLLRRKVTRLLRAAAREEGMFTAELAAGLPALVLLFGVGLTAVDAVRLRVWCLHAAREAAVAQSRGGVAPAWVDPPAGAAVTATADERAVRIRVHTPVRVFGAPLPRLLVTATAVAAWEPGAGTPATPARGGPRR